MTATGNAYSVTGEAVSGTTPLKQSADPAVGFRLGVRHIFSPIFGLEANFGYNPATQHFTGGVPSQDGVVYSHAKPFTFDYVVTFPHLFHGFQPFALGGAGLISYNISSYVETPPGQPALPVRPIKVPVGEYGIGADYHPSQFPKFYVDEVSVSRSRGPCAGLSAAISGHQQRGEHCRAAGRPGVQVLTLSPPGFSLVSHPAWRRSA